MRRPPRCHLLQSGRHGRRALRLPAWCPRPCSNILRSIDFTNPRTRSRRAERRPRGRRQAACMAKTEKRRKPGRLPRQVTRAVAAAEDKKALDIALLDLRKALGFADYFLICSGGNARQVRAIADGIMEALAADGAKPA